MNDPVPWDQPGSDSMGDLRAVADAWKAMSDRGHGELRAPGGYMPNAGRLWIPDDLDFTASDAVRDAELERLRRSLNEPIVYGTYPAQGFSVTVDSTGEPWDECLVCSRALALGEVGLCRRCDPLTSMNRA